MADLLPVYVVLGASGAIGSEVCRRLYGGGARLMMGARHVEKLDTLQEDLPDSLYFGFDAQYMHEVERCVEQAINMWGRVDGVAHCVGHWDLKPARETTDDEWNRIILLNLSSAFAVVRAAARFMIDGGSVVLLGSALAEASVPRADAFAAAMGGVAGLAVAAAATYAPSRIRINAVAPGRVRSPSGDASNIDLPNLPAHDPGQVAQVIAWLLRLDNPLTGRVLGIDEGLAQAK